MEDQVVSIPESPSRSVVIPVTPQMHSTFAADLKCVHALIETIQKTISGVHISLQPEGLVLTSETDEPIRRVQLVADMIGDHMRQWFKLQRNVVGEVSSNSRGPIFVEEFAIPQSHMGSAIGPKGSNINGARRIDGVERINNRFVAPSKNLFQIKARTPEAAKEAKEILEYNRLTVKVPREMVGRVIGTQGSNIQAIVDKSGTDRVSIDQETPERDGCHDMIYFVFHGMGLPLVDAKIMVTLILHHTTRMGQMRKECLGGGEKKDVSTSADGGGEKKDASTSADDGGEKKDASTSAVGGGGGNIPTIKVWSSGEGPLRMGLCQCEPPNEGFVNDECGVCNTLFQ